jgi:hypothetical protein
MDLAVAGLGLRWSNLYGQLGPDVVPVPVPIASDQLTSGLGGGQGLDHAVSTSVDPESLGNLAIVVHTGMVPQPRHHLFLDPVATWVDGSRVSFTSGVVMGTYNAVVVTTVQT